MKELLRIRDFRLLWTGQAISNFGDALTNLALLLTAQRLTGSTAAVATTAIAAALPTLVFGLFAGAYVDRWNRKRVMIVSDLFRSSFVLLFLLVTTADMMWLLYIVAFVQASLGTFFGPAKSAYLPRIVGKDNLLAANSISQMTQIVLGLAGTAVAGLIAATADTLSPAFLIDAGSFFLSLLMIALIRTDADPKAVQTPERPKILADVREGLSTVLRSPVLKGVLVGAGVLMFGLGATNVLLVPFIVDVLAVRETWFAAIEGSQVVSMVAASTLVALLARKIKATSIITLGLVGDRRRHDGHLTRSGSVAPHGDPLPGRVGDLSAAGIHLHAGPIRSARRDAGPDRVGAVDGHHRRQRRLDGAGGRSRRLDRRSIRVRGLRRIRTGCRRAHLRPVQGRDPARRRVNRCRGRRRSWGRCG